ncbi:MAG: hypothetical protein ONB46_08465 [candidate division KSB1 bacterium]|nr:hypothetical protein [candidate division KSB1 bacterium]MDZ7365944.1 hypothetical protein [candidate division KSB1 bacterium]MDZ7403822.1 hypothetical protein [candidate division KSB1 bacterium]
MKEEVYAADFDHVTPLNQAIATLREKARFAILERIDDIAFPKPAAESIDAKKWTKGKLFDSQFELRWELLEGKYRTIFSTEGKVPPPDQLKDKKANLDSTAWDYTEPWYFLWDENNNRLGRTLHYECLEPSAKDDKRNVMLRVREYRNERGRLVFWRYIEMQRREPEDKQ